MKLTLPSSKLPHSNIPSSSSSSSFSPPSSSHTTTNAAVNPISHHQQQSPNTATTIQTLPTMSLTPKTPTTTPYTITHRNRRRPRDKLLVILGATGAGKSRLSIDLATNTTQPSEIINSDKIQLYSGLDITTNKIPYHDRKQIPHHLLGTFSSPIHGDITPSHFRHHASATISSIVSRRHFPILVGGSNSFVHALLTDRFNPHYDPFDVSSSSDYSRNQQQQLKYNCCFLWVDVSPPILELYLHKRVDQMMESGMLTELTQYYNSGEVDTTPPQTGIRKAIGVPEFERYFRHGGGDERSLYDEAVREIKENTCRLAKKQVEKIQRLKSNNGWDLRRVDATQAIIAVLDGKSEDEFRMKWDIHVRKPSIELFKRFLDE